MSIINGTQPQNSTDFTDPHMRTDHSAVHRTAETAIAVVTTSPNKKGSDWPEPTPLPNSLPPVHPFTPDLLPEALRAWVMDISDRMQCPPDFSAIAAVTALSSLIGAKHVICPKANDDWAVVVNLWAMIIARPGAIKSPAISQALAPLVGLQSAELTRWTQAVNEWKLDSKVDELAGDLRFKEARKIAVSDPAKARSLLEIDQKADEPKQRRYIVNDATVEALGEILADNPWGTLAHQDELHGLLAGLDRQGQEGSRAFYLTGFDGDKSYQFDRITRGETHIKRVCIAMLGGIQPGRIQTYVRSAVAGGSGDDGLIQRFGLTVWPDVSSAFTYVDRWPDNAAKQSAWTVFERLAALKPSNEDDSVVWRFSPEAQTLFVEWYTELRTELQCGQLHPALESHLSKYAKTIPALALIFALVDTPESEGIVHDTQLIRALAWGDYLRSHAERLYSVATRPELAGADNLLSKIRAGNITVDKSVVVDSFTARQIAAKGWSGLAEVADVRKAADVLVDHEWLQKEIVRSNSGDGRPSERYLIHPMLRNPTGRQGRSDS